MTLVISKGITLDNGTRAAAIAGVSPTLDYRFAREKREIETVSLTDKLTYTGGNGTFVGSDGFIQRATTNVPRFDHDPLSRQSLGLLVEEQRTNFATQSELFSGWNVGNLVQSTATVASPSGGSTAQLFVEDTATSPHRLFLSPTTGQLTNSLFVWVKPASGTRRFYIESDGPTGTRRTLRFNLQAGTVEFNAGDWTNPFITAYANGWFKVGGTITDNGGSVLFIVGSSDGVASSYTGDGTSGFYLWGAQLEAATTPSTYIPTTASTVTRTADSAVIDGTGVLTGTYTLVEKPAGCAVVSGSNINLEPGFTAERVMVFPAALDAGQITAIRGAM